MFFKKYPAAPVEPEELEKNCWYWYYWHTIPEKGGSWYPIYIGSDGYVNFDGIPKKIGILNGMTLRKALMPVTPPIE